MAKCLLFAAALALVAATAQAGVKLVPQGADRLLNIPASRNDLLVKTAPFTSFPLYKQCDPRWGSDKMGVNGPGERNTICNEGCAMSSAAMALAGLGAHINGSLVDPGTFNTWLKANDGYLCLAGDCNNLVLNASEKLSVVMNLIGEYQVEDDFEMIAQEIERRRIIYIAHVRHNTHFVLLTQRVPGQRAFYVNDPGFNETIYPYANITDLIRYKVNVYPLYKQCNSSWGNLPMGGGPNNYSICDVGCLMSSTSMALAGTGIKVSGQPANPETLNHWLQNNGGYLANTSDLIESAVMKVDPGHIVWNSTGFRLSNNIPWLTVQEMIDQEVPPVVIANVMHGQHFVLVVGYRHDGDTLVVNDPGFNRNTYSYMNDVVGWRVFWMH